MRWCKLAKTAYIFIDSKTRFSLGKGEVKPLPAQMGEQTRLWLQSGGIVICEPPQTAVLSSDPIPSEPVEIATLPEAKSFEDRVEELKQFSKKTLREICLEKKIKFSYRSDETKLAEKIAESELGSK